MKPPLVSGIRVDLNPLLGQLAAPDKQRSPPYARPMRAGVRLVDQTGLATMTLVYVASSWRNEIHPEVRSRRTTGTRFTTTASRRAGNPAGRRPPDG